MEFASNAEYDAQLAQFYSRTISPGAVDKYQAKLFGWKREPSERELGVGKVFPTTSDYE